MKEFKTRVISNRKLSAGEIYLLTVEMKNRGLREVIPGQFAMIGTRPIDGVLLRRPYSIFDFSKDGSKAVMKFFYKVVGRGTELLKSTEKGAGISMLAPLGRGFELQKAKGKSLLIVTGGIGVAPFYFLLKSFAKAKPGNIFIFYGARNKGDLFFQDFFSRHSDRIFVSTDDGSKGYRGLVADLFKEKLAEASFARAVAGTDLLVYTCGPRPMMRSVARISEEKGIPCMVSMEELMGCGLGACLSCVVQSRGNDGYLTVCKDGPVFDSRDIVV